MRTVSLTALALCIVHVPSEAQSPCTTEDLVCQLKLVEARDPNNPVVALANSEVSHGCQAERSWNKLRGTPSDPLPQKSRDALSTLLANRCAKEETLDTADTFLRQGRYSDASEFYNKVPKLGEANSDTVSAERARHGAITAARLGKTLLRPPRAIVRLEAAKQFDEAYTKITHVAPETDAHRKLLATLLAVKQTAQELEARRDYGEARKAYVGLMSLIDPLRDSNILDYVRTEITRLTPLAFAQADEEASSLISLGDAQAARGEYEKAISTYEKVTEKQAAISPVIASKAFHKAAESRIAAAKEPSFSGAIKVFVAALGDSGVRLVSYLPYFIVGFGIFCMPLLLVWAVTQLLPARKGILLTLVDRTATTDGDANTVTEQMQKEINWLHSGREGLHVELAGEDSGSGLAHLRIGLALSELEEAIGANAPIAFGPLSINPVQWIKALTPLFRRRSSFELSGSVVSDGPDTFCTVVVDRYPRGTALPNKVWTAQAIEPDAKTRTIRAVAMQILIDLDPGARRITTNWQSLVGLREGLLRLSRQNGSPDAGASQVEEARQCLQDALLADPGNSSARFNLALVLTKVGLNGLAADQLRELMERQDSRLPADYLLAAKYNLAVSLQKADDDRLAEQALILLTDVLEHSQNEKSLRESAQSGIYAVWAQRLVRRKRRMMATRNTKEARESFTRAVNHWRDAALEGLTKLEGDIAEDHSNLIGSNGQEENIQMTVDLNAVGQLLDLSQRPHEARDYYRRAITLMPTFLEPSLNLASLYIEQQKSLDVNWATRAESLLVDVQRFEPENTRASYLLGYLYAHPIFGRSADAEKWLKLSLPNPLAARRLAGLLLDLDRASEAVAPLVSALEQEPRDLSSNRLLALCAIMLPPDSKGRCKLLSRSEKWLKKRIAGDPTGVQRLNKLLRKVQLAKASCINREPSFSLAKPIADGAAHSQVVQEVVNNQANSNPNVSNQ